MMLLLIFLQVAFALVSNKSLTVLSNKEHLNVYVNRPSAELYETLDTDDRLVMVFMNKLDFKDEQLSQKWSMLDQLFLEVILKLQGGYVHVFYYDCKWFEELKRAG